MGLPALPGDQGGPQHRGLPLLEPLRLGLGKTEVISLEISSYFG